MDDETMRLIGEIHADVKTVKHSVSKLDTRLITVEDDFKFRVRIWKTLFGSAGLLTVLIAVASVLKVVL